MAKGNNEAKIKFTAETAGFTKAVTSANQSLGALGAELKLNAAQMQGAADNADMLAERKELLAQQLEAASNKTEALRQKMAAATEIYGENSAEALKLKRQVALAATAEEKIRQQIEKVNTELKEQAAESGKTKTAFDSLEGTISEQETAMEGLKKAYADAVLTYGKNSKEAKTLAKEIRSLGSELNDNKTKMSAAETAAEHLEQATQDAGDAAEDANDGFTVWKGTLANLASSAIQGALSGIQNLASTFWNLGDETRELRTNMGKIETAFETAGMSADAASQTYEDFYGIVGDEGQATEAVNHLAKLTDSQKELDEWTRICTGVYGSFGDSLPIENLTEAANETAKTGTVTGGLADALNWSTMSSEEWTQAFNGHPKALKKFQNALKSGMTTEEAFNEALTKCTTESEREQVIRQALTGLYGDAADAYAETNGEIIEANKAQANYNNALAGLGEIIEPIKTVFTNGMASMLESVTALFEGLDTEAIKTAIADAFGYINDTVFPAIKTGIQWFIDNKDLVIGAIAGIVAGIAAFKVVTIVQTAVGIFKAFQAATTGLTLAQKALNLVMMANPIAIIIALVVGLVAAFIYLWNNCEWFRDFWIGLWENIKSIAGTVVDALVNFFTVTVPAAWSTFSTFVSELWSKIWSTISTWASNIWSSVTEWFTNTKNSVGEAVSGIWNSVTEWFSKIWSSIVSVVTNIWTSVTTWFNNVKTSVSNIVSSVWTTVTAIWNNIKNAIVNTALSIWTSITATFNSIKTTITSVWSSVKGAISSVWSGIKTTISNAINSVKETVTSVFNTVKNTISTIWTGIKGTIMAAWNGIKSNVSTAVGAVKEKVSTAFNAVKNTVSSIWNGIKTTISSVWATIKTTISTAVTTVKTKISSVFDSVKSKVTTVWNGIKDAIEGPINTAKATVESVVSKIKGAFDFDWSLPKPKFPSFKVSGGEAPWGFMGKGSLPKVSVIWNAKGAVLEDATIFGMTGNSFLGGGEAGPEAVAPIDVLLGYVREAVRDVFTDIGVNSPDERVTLSNMDKLETYISASSNDMGRLINAIEDLADRAIELNIDGVRFARATAGANDNVSGQRLNLKTRGLVL